MHSCLFVRFLVRHFVRPGLVASAWAAAAAVHATPVFVSVTDAQGAPLADAVVSVHVRGTNPVATGKTVELVQRRRRFESKVLAVQQGTAVLFPNFDTVRHHVYSFSAAKTFQIKLYAATPTEPVVFDKPGTAVLGCNIHDSMLAHVRVVDSPYFARTDAQGRAELDVPAGSHILKLWHPSLGAEAEPPAHALTLGTEPQSLALRWPAP